MSETAVEQLSREAIACSLCFQTLPLSRSRVAWAQPRWIGPDYWSSSPRVLVIMLNPGSGEARKDGFDEKFNSLLAAFASGQRTLSDVLEHQLADMPNWGHGRFLSFYVTGIGIPLNSVAFANIAWCATKGNHYPPQMLQNCFQKHTRVLIRMLRPDVVVLSGSAAHQFQLEVRHSAPEARLILMLHYAHRKGRSQECSELARVRGAIAGQLSSQ